MEKQNLTVKDSSLAFFSSFLLCQLGIVIFACLGLIVCSFFNINQTNFESFLNSAVGYLITVVIMNGLILLTFFYFNKNKDNKIITKPKLIKILIYIIIAIAAYLSLTPLVTAITVFLNNIGYTSTSIPYSLTTKNYFISLISLVLIPAVCEELIFRGLILKGLKPCGKLFSIFISALMFSLFHMSIEQFVYPLLIGLLLGVIMYNENNIIYCIIIHLINNFLALTFAYFGINLAFNHWSFFLLAAILSICFVLCLIHFIAKSKQEKSNKKLNKTERFYLFGCIGIISIIWIVVLIVSFIYHA